MWLDSFGSRKRRVRVRGPDRGAGRVFFCDVSGYRQPLAVKQPLERMGEVIELLDAAGTSVSIATHRTPPDG